MFTHIQTHTRKLVLLAGPFVALGLGPATVNADTITVCWDGSGDYLTIQEGIDAASDGDEVVVCDGTYTGPGNKNLDFHGKAITVRSANGPDNCLISGGSAGLAFHFHNEETETSIVDGFTIAGFWGFAGGAMLIEQSSPTIVNCVFHENHARYGGAVFNWEGAPTFIHCRFIGNEASGSYASYGGAIYNYSPGQPLIAANCLFVGNTALCGGAIFSIVHVTMTNCLFAGNTGVEGAGVIHNTGGTAILANCIAWGNSSQPPYGPIYGQAIVTYTCVEGGRPGWGNIDGDPVFVDPDGPDDDPNTWEDNDYHLSPGSPCIDAGCNGGVPRDSGDLDNDGDTEEITPLDLDGEGRFFDDPDTPDTGCGFAPIVDMGAYEFGDTGPQPCPGDMDGDRDVDHSDLGILLSLWGATDECDLDCDGDIDQGDLAILLVHWGERCP